MRALQSTATLLLAAALGLGGCTTLSSERFYQLHTAASTQPDKDAGPAVLLGPLTLADYLDRDSLVQREPDGSLTIDSGLRWAGSLKDDVAQVLLRQLSGRLGTSRVAVYPDRVGLRPDAQIRLSIGRLDSGPAQPAVLEAQWRLLDGDGDLLASRVVRLEEPHDGSVGDQVRAQSALLEQLAEQLAEAIRPLTGSAAARSTPTAGEEQTASSDGLSAPVFVGPSRRDGEVFRF